jgi:hypothetical protein
VLAGERLKTYPTPNGGFSIRGTGRHVDALARYEELREAIEEWGNQRRGEGA